MWLFSHLPRMKHPQPHWFGALMILKPRAPRIWTPPLCVYCCVSLPLLVCFLLYAGSVVVWTVEYGWCLRCCVPVQWIYRNRMNFPWNNYGVIIKNIILHLRFSKSLFCHYLSLCGWNNSEPVVVVRLTKRMNLAVLSGATCLMDDISCTRSAKSTKQ